MPLIFEPLSHVSETALVQYLERRGLPGEVARWKYCDRAFNRGRERGFAWIREGRIQGLIGTLPARVRHDGGTAAVSWACDWSLEEPEKSPGVGILLLRHAAESVERLTAFGGNATSLRFFPQLAARTSSGAAKIFQFPVRLRPILEKLGRRLPGLRLDRWPLLPDVPLSTGLSDRKSDAVRIHAGVSADLVPLLQPGQGQDWCPLHDLEDVRWMLERCPRLECWSLLAPKEGPAEAGGVLWRLRNSRERWRAALWAGEGQTQLLRAILSKARSEVLKQGGSLLSILVSARDTPAVLACRAEGGLESADSIPIFFFGGGENGSSGEFSRLSYLDSDYFCLF